MELYIILSLLMMFIYVVCIHTSGEVYTIDNNEKLVLLAILIFGPGAFVIMCGVFAVAICCLILYGLITLIPDVEIRFK